MVDNIMDNLKESLPVARANIELLSEMDPESLKDADTQIARQFLGRIYFSTVNQLNHLVPAKPDEDMYVKQTRFDIIKEDPIMTKAALRFFRTCFASDVATYMKRLVAMQPDLTKTTQDKQTHANAIEVNYFDEVFDGRHFNRKTSSLNI